MAKEKVAKSRTKSETDSNKNTSEQNNKQNNEQKLCEQIETLQNDLNIQADRFLRLAAEYDNYRKRSEKDKIAIYNNAKCKTISEILPIADCIENAVKSLKGADGEYQKGMQMLHDQVMSALSKMGVESFGTVGEKFDPECHNAISHVDDENLEENVIFEVFQKGYTCGDKIIRHAMVSVAN